MVVIALGRLRDFWEVHPTVGTPLKSWYDLTIESDWSKFADVRGASGRVSLVGSCVVFNIGGNKDRLVTRIIYPARKVFVLRIMTHAEYDDQERW